MNAEDSPSPRLLVVLGATATGKSDLALELARRLPGEIVSVDASCVYRGLDIGTAKPRAAMRREVPHHLVDCCDPREDFSASRFVSLAEEAIAGIVSRSAVPVLAGGTGLYLRCLLRGLVESAPPDEELRERLERREQSRPGSLRRILARLDPGAAARLGAGDVFRMVRALEHRIATGRTFSGDQREWAGAERFPALKIGLELPRPERETRIRARIDAMLAGGLVEETRRLLDQGVPPDARSLRALGYREAVLVLRGEMPESGLKEALAVATRQYAKRQDTWFRREPGVLWMPAPSSERELSALAERVMLAWLRFGAGSAEQGGSAERGIGSGGEIPGR